MSVRESVRESGEASDRDSDHGSSPAVAFFRDTFGLDETSLSAALGTALERRVDDADLFFEYSTQDSVELEEGIVKTIDWYLASEKWLGHVVSGDYKNYYEDMYSGR